MKFIRLPNTPLISISLLTQANSATSNVIHLYHFSPSWNLHLLQSQPLYPTNQVLTSKEWATYDLIKSASIINSHPLYLIQKNALHPS